MSVWDNQPYELRLKPRSPPYVTTLDPQERQRLYQEWLAYNETNGPPMSFGDFALSKKSGGAPKEPPSAVPAQ